MRHDAERPKMAQLNASVRVPGQWIQVLSTMRASVFTRLSIEDIRAEAAHILIVSPTAEVTRVCFTPMLEGLSVTEDFADDDFVEIITAEELVPEDVPAGTWIFLPHRQDGWTELETTSARVHARLIKENTARERDAKLTLIEYGVNLWLWAEPPYGGGDPVCHAGELISWESAWALTAPATSTPHPGSTATRPPIFFGLPPVLRRRRLGE